MGRREVGRRPVVRARIGLRGPGATPVSQRSRAHAVTVRWHAVRGSIQGRGVVVSVCIPASAATKDSRPWYIQLYYRNITETKINNELSTTFPDIGVHVTLKSMFYTQCCFCQVDSTNLSEILPSVQVPCTFTWAFGLLI